MLKLLQYQEKGKNKGAHQFFFKQQLKGLSLSLQIIANLSYVGTETPAA
jgi:hypothetical protein